ncbi:MBL fold metallo-hydrolase [Flavobacterium sp. KBS0721]|uniref:MBL fold metallo-hydrolase n=1 Tax=Flavobacterium sp. KBS0721 TaxID=1179672 RepID=UPI00098F7697|nr:MBL fold metallo-hydrolase [Flavobacterium sp. KBS0721]QDW20360.1 MBL fold metallo-hydrolase [Flavobacterium sp. KBS0721]
MDLPHNDEVEITIIGTGGGYGESIIIKLAKSSWIVVDCCINPNTREPLPLEYLKSIGVDYANDVVKVICTHWHDDHIRGISKLLEACEKAQFSPTRINDTKKFMAFVDIDEKIHAEGGVRSTKEFKECTEILKKRKIPANRLNSNMVVYKESYLGVEFELFALSPSDFVIEQFDHELSNIIKRVFERKLSVINETPNDKCVVLLLKFRNQRVLLGADLEVGDNPNQGWTDILDNSLVTDGVKAQLFKIPHHGSENGYHERIFKELVATESTLKLTPWNLNEKLPTGEMIDCYQGHSKEIYITSPIISSKRPKAKKREREIERIIESFNKTLAEVKYDEGVIRSRINYIKCEGWDTKIFKSAFKIV